MRGTLIAFEGVEGCGKTTQLQQTQAWLAARVGRPWVVATREPGGTAVGERLRSLLLEGPKLAARTELLLYAADRAQHVAETIGPQLERGAIVLCDRYADSTLAYQGYGRGLALASIEQLHQMATGGLASDLTLWLDVDVATARARIDRRGSADHMDGAERAFHQRVRDGFAQLAAACPHRIARIDAEGPSDQVQQQIRTVVRQRLGWPPAR